MGLILCCAMLVALYCIKIFYPNVVVGVAEIKPIVKFGNFIDKYDWAYYLFYGSTSMLILWFYTCACCRVNKLGKIELCVLFGLVVLSHIIEKYLPTQSLVFNISLYLIMPLIVVTKRRIKDYRIFYSTVVCFLITNFAQTISLDIRAISTMVSYPNSATYFILLIDAYIWNVLLYNYYNFKGVKKDG